MFGTKYKLKFVRSVAFPFFIYLDHCLDHEVLSTSVCCAIRDWMASVVCVARATKDRGPNFQWDHLIRDRLGRHHEEAPIDEYMFSPFLLSYLRTAARTSLEIAYLKSIISRHITT